MFLIREIAEKFNLQKDTIRYYDKIGLLKPSERKQNGYRLYSISDFKKLSFILKSKNIGLSLKAIKDLVNMYENPSSYSCKEVKEVAFATPKLDANKPIVSPAITSAPT